MRLISGEEMDGRPLIGLTRSEAEHLADRVNAAIGGLAGYSPVPFAGVA
ncbi:hypothetical protein [Mesorhizobium argentiipisi]|uniref:Uncharacterized protein n=1 Tax=Mesorhizobium argentiipisi TaxID=3015175 RepID=A0ABU8KKQ6_9HYPH